MLHMYLANITMNNYYFNCDFRGAKTGMKDINSCTPFLLAAANGHSEVIRQFDENKELTNLDKNRRSAVFLAAEGDHLSLLKVGYKDNFSCNQ